MYTVQAGCCRLPWMNVTRFEDFGELSDVFGSFGAAAAGALGALSALSCGRAGSVRLVVTPPGVLRVEYGVARGATRRRFLQARHRRDLHTRIITHFHQGLAPPTTGGVAVEHPGPCSRRRPLSRGLTHQKIPPS